MIYKFTTITVKNLEESLKFYTEVLDLSVTRRFSPRPGMNIAFLQDEAKNEIELIQNDLESPDFDNIPKSIVMIGFGVKSLDDSMKFLDEKGIKIARGPMPIPKGRFIIIDDPNGVGIGLYEEVE